MAFAVVRPVNCRTDSPGPISEIWEYFKATLETFSNFLRCVREIGSWRHEGPRKKAPNSAICCEKETRVPMLGTG